MDSRSAHLKHPPVLAVGVLLAVFFAQVHCAPLQAGQAILFSSPIGDTVGSNAPSLSLKPVESLDFGNSSQIPLPLDLNGPPVVVPPLPGPRTISPTEQAKLQDLSDRRRNWILLTPAEILGATTPEKILGIQERDAAGQPKYSTAWERYTERRNQKLSANTNAFRYGDSSSVWNASRNRRDPFDVFSSGNGGSGNAASMANPLFDTETDNRTLAGRSQNSGESKLFGSPTPLPAPNAAQQMSLERFKQLLGSSPSPALTATPSSNDKLFSPPGMSPDVKSGQSSLNPMGASFSPLNSSIGKPAELPTLPKSMGLSYTSSRPAAAWVPQPPPWMSADPQPLTAPQRRF
jgi:hypothetical protein